MRRLLVVALAGGSVAAVALLALRAHVSLGPVVVASSAIPAALLAVSGRRLWNAVPDVVFGAIDTGLLAIPAVAGAAAFGVLGAVAGGVVGDAVTDSIAGFFEGAAAEWLRSKGLESGREALTASLGKMAGCLFAGGLVLWIASLLGLNLR